MEKWWIREPLANLVDVEPN